MLEENNDVPVTVTCTQNPKVKTKQNNKVIDQHVQQVWSRKFLVGVIWQVSLAIAFPAAGKTT